MRSRSQLLGCMAALATLVSGHFAAANQQNSHEVLARKQLSERIIRQVTFTLSEQHPTTSAVELATLLAEEAVKLDPNNETGWRIVLQLAEMAEEDRSQERALQALGRLDPHDEVVRLKRAHRRIEQHQTVEGRIAEYRNLLSIQNRDRIGPAAASRLALDLALLERRAGNSANFADWLAEAVALDPSHRAAAALAAGYFRANVTDAFAEAELLVSLLMADPIQVTSQVALAGHLLENGAYHGAQRLYALAMNTNEAGRMRPNRDLVADLAIAQWGDGDPEAALRTIRDYQRFADMLHRRQMQEQRPEMTSLELAREVAMVDPTIAVLRTAIHRRLDSDLADPSLAGAIGAYEKLIRAASDEDPPDSVKVAQLKLELAWVMVWLDGNNTQRVRDLLADAEQFEALSDVARSRFDGWLALRHNDLAAAIDFFKPFIKTDAAAGLGYATALLAQGHRRDAARELLTLARQQAGTVIGVWAADVLWEVLGQRTSTATETAMQLEQLVAAIPSVVDRFPRDPSTAFSIRVSPVKTTFEPYESLIVNLEITNHAPFPLAISPDGPIRSQVVLHITAEMVRAGKSERIPPVVVDIDRRFRLMPRERLIVPVDLRSTMVGHLLDRAPLPGAIMRVKGIINFIVTPQGAIVPGVLGTERETPPFRIDGYRVTTQWVEQTMASLVDQRGDIDLSLLASLCHVAASHAGSQTEALRRLFMDARTVLVEVYARLDGDTQAWMLSVLPRSDVFAPILTMARQSPHRPVQLSYLLHHVGHQDDPMLAAAQRSSDPGLKRLAELIQPRLRATDEPSYSLPTNR